MEYSNKQRKVLFDRINSLSSTEHEEILKIVKKYNATFSQNKNGIFFNLSSLSDEAVKEIYNFVNYCISNKKELDEYDKIINECKMSNNLKTIMPTHDIAPTLNTSLANMGKIDIESEIFPANTWASLKVDEATVEKFVKFVDKFNHDKDKICRKKMNVKYNNAKKRYSKKISERKIDTDQADVLGIEEYIICTRTQHKNDQSYNNNTI